jgi:hypothetical protein
MARFVEVQRLEGTPIHINIDRIDYVCDAKHGEAVVSFGTHEIGIRMTARDFRDRAKALE